MTDSLNEELEAMSALYSALQDLYQFEIGMLAGEELLLQQALLLQEQGESLGKYNPQIERARINLEKSEMKEKIARQAKDFQPSLTDAEAHQYTDSWFNMMWSIKMNPPPSESRKIIIFQKLFLTQNKRIFYGIQ